MEIDGKIAGKHREKVRHLPLIVADTFAYVPRATQICVQLGLGLFARSLPREMEKWNPFYL